MKLRWVFLFGAGIALLTVASGFGAALLLTDRETWVLTVTLVCTMLLITAPAIAGALIANFTFDVEETDGRRILRRLLLVIGGIQLLAVIGLVFVTIAVPELTVFLIGIVVISAALLLGCIRLGMRAQRRVAIESAGPEGWSPWSQPVIKNKATRVIVVFVIATVIGVTAMGGLDLVLLDGEDTSPVAWVVYGLSFGFISASVACIVVAWPLMKELRQSLGRDYATQKTIGRVVLRDKDDELSESGRQRAATYAAIMSVYLPFQITQFALLFGGLWLQQLWNLVVDLSGQFSSLTIGMVVAYPLLLAIFLPVIIRQARRAKRYAAEHADLARTNVTDPDGPRTA